MPEGRGFGGILVTTLRSADAALTSATHQAADALDAIGTVALDRAMDRLQQSASDAIARQRRHQARLNAILSGVLDAYTGGEILLQLDLAGADLDLPALPAPAAASGPASAVELYLPPVSAAQATTDEDVAQAANAPRDDRRPLPKKPKPKAR